MEAAAVQQSWEAAVSLVYQTYLGRDPNPDELKQRALELASGSPFPHFLNSVRLSDEAAARKKHISAGLGSADISDGEFISWLYEALVGRGATAQEIEMTRADLVDPDSTRSDLVIAHFAQYLARRRAESAASPLHDVSQSLVLGTEQVLDRKSWARLANAPRRHEKAPAAAASHFTPRRDASPPRATIIASLYRGGQYIERYLDNITSQTIFQDCELIIIDADSPEDEHKVIEQYQARFPQIVYLRMPHRIGIYTAWNIAVSMARGEYLTNANLDDLRRADSLERQVGALDSLPFVDVVYQDVFYTLDPTLSFAEIEAVGVKTELPSVTPHNIVHFNSPHNAPMWRKALHSDIGYFNDSLRSAGDWEFWVRCTVAGRTFFKLNDPHVAYYVNPEGISTRPDTPGVEEARRISKKLWSEVAPRASIEEPSDFLRRCSAIHGLTLSAVNGSRYDHVQLLLRDLAQENEFRRHAEEVR